MPDMFLSDMYETWDSGGTTYTSIKMNVTDTASAAGSGLLDLQVGGVSRIRVSKTGTVTFQALTSGPQAIYNGATGGSGRYLEWQTSGSARWRLIGASLDAESGSNAGSDFIIQALNDSGGFIGNAITITRAIATVTFLYAPKVGSDTVFHTGNLGGAPITWTANQTLSDVNLVLGTTTGTKIGTSASQKLGFFNATPVVQPAAVADATDAASAITQLNALLSRVRSLGLIAT